MDKEIKYISIEELKTIQLDILEAIDLFCSQHNIVYSMACGTLLGAVRHKGYIPWDDDIDIYLLREDYNKLISFFPDRFQDVYELISLERNEKWDRPYAKAFDSRTVFQENADNSVTIGVNIDVYPIDDVPDDEIEWSKYDRFRRVLQKLYEVKWIRLSRKRGVFKNLVLLIMKLPLLVVSRRRFALILDNYCQKHNGKGYDSVFECVQGLLQKHRFSKSLFMSVVRIPFENRSFLGFKDYDIYLRNGYGDYMQLPPVEKRVAHHAFKAYWE